MVRLKITLLIIRFTFILSITSFPPATSCFSSSSLFYFMLSSSPSHQAYPLFIHFLITPSSPLLFFHPLLSYHSLSFIPLLFLFPSSPIQSPPLFLLYPSNPHPLSSPIQPPPSFLTHPTLTLLSHPSNPHPPFSPIQPSPSFLTHPTPTLLPHPSNPHPPFSLIQPPTPQLTSLQQFHSTRPHNSTAPDHPLKCHPKTPTSSVPPSSNHPLKISKPPFWSSRYLGHCVAT